MSDEDKAAAWAASGASENRRGRPFPKANSEGRRWPKGVSGNPGGRPRLPPREVRDQWRAAASELARQMTTQTDPEMLMAQAMAFKELADRSGMESESVTMRAFAAVLDSQSITHEQRAALVAAWIREQEGEDELCKTKQIEAKPGCGIVGGG